MVDAAQTGIFVAVLSNEILQHRFRALVVIAARLARPAAHEIDRVTISRLGALAFLHDIGKANRGFQSRSTARVRFLHLFEAGLFEAGLVDGMYFALPALFIRCWSKSLLFVNKKKQYPDSLVFRHFFLARRGHD